MVSVAAAAAAPLPGCVVDLLAAYDADVGAMPVCASIRFARRRSARRFLDRYPDLGAWMHRSTPARLADLHRLKAWPFVS